jgi:hypothetical protein
MQKSKDIEGVNKFTLTNCKAEGSIKSVGKCLSGETVDTPYNKSNNVGGIIGSIACGFWNADCFYSKGTIEITGCKSGINMNSTLAASDEGSYIGNILGVTLDDVSIQDCKAWGKISVNSNCDCTGGGLIGYCYALTAKGSGFCGDFECTAKNCNIGGIVGECDNGLIIDACYLCGRLQINNETNYSCLGGLIGMCHIEQSINDCCILGDILSSQNASIGGVAGFSWSVNTKRNFLFNRISTTTGSSVGAYVGSYGCGGLDIDNASFFYSETQDASISGDIQMPRPDLKITATPAIMAQVADMREKFRRK